MKKLFLAAAIATSLISSAHAQWLKIASCGFSGGNESIAIDVQQTPTGPAYQMVIKDQAIINTLKENIRNDSCLDKAFQANEKGEVIHNVYVYTENQKNIVYDGMCGRGLGLWIIQQDYNSERSNFFFRFPSEVRLELNCVWFR